MIRNLINGLVLATACLQPSCNSSSNSGQGSCIDMSGTWNVTQVEDDTQCGGGIVTNDATASGTQNGCSFTLSGGGETLSGIVSGNQISGNFSASDLGGAGSGTFAGTISEDAKTVTANSSWTWHDGTASCSGTTVTTATRISGPDAG
jgi:hypothetical protein